MEGDLGIIEREKKPPANAEQQGTSSAAAATSESAPATVENEEVGEAAPVDDGGQAENQTAEPATNGVGEQALASVVSAEAENENAALFQNQQTGEGEQGQDIAASSGPDQVSVLAGGTNETTGAGGAKISGSSVKSSLNVLQSQMMTDQQNYVEDYNKMDSSSNFQWTEGGKEMSSSSKILGDQWTEGGGEMGISNFGAIDSDDFLFEDICAGLSEDECSAVVNETFDHIVLRIETQSNIINKLKERIREKNCKYPKTGCEDNEIRNLNVCILEENKKLHSMLRQVLLLQERHPDRKWSAIQLATTYLEDNEPVYLNICRPLCDNEDLINSISNFKSPLTESSAKASQTCSLGNYSDLFANLAPEKRKGYEYIDRNNDPLFQVHPENRHGQSLHPKNRRMPRQMCLDLQKKKHHQSKIPTDCLFKYIQNKVDNIQKELRGMAHGMQRSQCEKRTNRCTITKSETSVDRRTKDIVNIVSRIQDLLDCNQDEKESGGDESTGGSQDKVDCLSIPCKECKCHQQGKGIQTVSVADYEDLKCRYCDLLEDYNQKDREVSKLKATIRNLNERREKQENHVTSDSGSAEVRVLHSKLQEYQGDNEDFKVLLCEQARQIDDYRVKYMGALQKVEEQRCFYQRMEMDSKRKEDQINKEIEQIKHKFNHQLKEYQEIPKLLENEQIKLAQCCREKNDLEMKLRLVCREYKSLKNAFKEKVRVSDDPEKCKKLSDELANLRQQYDILKESKDRLCLKYDQTRFELDNIRSESAKVICRLKERSTTNQTMLQKHIDNLEQDLAKCRASVCLSMADRDAVMKDMQAELNCLGVSFDSSQKQIRTLEDHIAYLSNGKNKSVIVCCENSKNRRG